MQPLGILETSLYADDLDAAERFYVDVLGLTTHSRDQNRHLFFRCGRGMLLIFNPDVTSTQQSVVADQLVPIHGARGPGHMAFEINEGNLASWRNQLRIHGVTIESEIAWPRGGHSIYFRDPAGNIIELATASLWGIE